VVRGKLNSERGSGTLHPAESTRRLDREGGRVVVWVATLIGMSKNYIGLKDYQEVADARGQLQQMLGRRLVGEIEGIEPVRAYPHQL
jgi:hypothetical protein